MLECHRVRFKVCVCVHVSVTEETGAEYIIAKIHRRPCARGTIHHANEVTPYGGSRLSARNTCTNQQIHIEELSALF